ncbi:MAG: hypothetical protein Q9167_007554 [Letrouitia subvulpina]
MEHAAARAASVATPLISAALPTASPTAAPKPSVANMPQPGSKDVLSTSAAVNMAFVALLPSFVAPAAILQAVAVGQHQNQAAEVEGLLEA